MQKAFTIKQPEEVAEVQEIREKLKKLEELESKTLEAEKAVETDVENTDLDKAWDEAYNEEYKQYSEVAKLIADLINIDTCTAKSMIVNYRDQLKKTLGLLKNADLTA